MKNKLQINKEIKKENVKICKAVHEIHVYSVKASQLGILSLESVCDSKSNFEMT